LAEVSPKAQFLPNKTARLRDKLPLQNVVNGTRHESNKLAPPWLSGGLLTKPDSNSAKTIVKLLWRIAKLHGKPKSNSVKACSSRKHLVPGWLTRPCRVVARKSNHSIHLTKEPIMAGLIQEQMMGEQPVDELMPEEEMNPEMGMDPGMQMGMGEDPMLEDDDEDLDTEDPTFQAAMQYAMQALYENEAARDVAQSLQSAADPVEALADVSYEITALVDERTDGEVPDELLVLLATTIMEEVADIGEAAGVEYQPAEIAEAFQLVIIRFLQENGMDTTELEQAMDQVDPSVFEQAANAEM
jgi:hypothetical protein